MATTDNLTSRSIGGVGASGVYRLELGSSGLSTIRSITIRDDRLVSGGTGAASGFDLDFIKLSTTATTSASTAASLTGLDAFNFTGGVTFRPGTLQTWTVTDPASWNRSYLFGADSAFRYQSQVATLGVRDAVNNADVGSVSIGEGGYITFHLTRAVATTGLYLYYGDSGGGNDASYVSLSDQLVPSEQGGVIVTGTSSADDLLLGTGLNRHLGGGNDTLDGSGGADRIGGGAGNDRLTGSAGNDYIDGGTGNDVAVFAAARSAYSVVTAGSRTVVAQLNGGGDGSDTLYGVEQLQFADQTVAITPLPLFEAGYYLQQNPDVARAGIDPYQHYATYGWTEGRDPTPGFDVSYYLATNPDVAAAGVDPLAHYLVFGWREGRDPSAGFDTSSYLATNPDVAAAGLNPLLHYLQWGEAEGRGAHAVHDRVTDGVDYSWYLTQYPDIEAARVDPRGHYESFGWREGRDPNAWFDTSEYLRNNPDVAAAGINPLRHYLDYGWREGRDPSAAFDVSDYLAANPDVAAAGVDPLTHYLIHGRDEGRALSPIGRGFGEVSGTLAAGETDGLLMYGDTLSRYTIAVDSADVVDPVIHVIGADGTVRAQGSGVGGNAYLSYTPTDATPVRVEVSSASGQSTGDYDIVAYRSVGGLTTTPSDPGDSRAAAYDIGVVGPTLNHHFEQSITRGDYDFYGFDLTERRQIDVSLSNTTGDLTLYVIQPNAQPVPASYDATRVPGNGSERLIATLDPGHYYVEVFGEPAVTSNYWLDIA